MSPRNSRSHNDSRANRLPYHPEPRQGRFGRVENWREAEERKAEQIRRQRQSHSRRLAQQGASDATPAQQPASTQASTNQARREQKQQPAINPWQQGRFGRVENWRDAERRQQELQEQTKRKTQREVRKTPTQQHVEKLEQQRAERKAQAQAQSGIQSQQRTRQITGSQRRASVVPQEASAQAHAQQQSAPQSGVSEAGQAQKVSGASQPAYLQSQQQHRQQQRSAAAPSDKASNYSRDSYVSNLKDKTVSTFADRRPGQSKFDRRPAVQKPVDKAKSIVGKIPTKILVAIAAVLVIIIAVSLFLSCSNQEKETAASNDGIIAQTTQKQASLPTPIMSESSGIQMHSAVAMEDLTEILIHNASYAYANEITTQLTEGTNTDIIDAHGTGRVAAEQPTGNNWMTGEFIRCFRSGNAGPIMSAIDCGGPVGATVYAPVTGEVVLVKEYDLYGEIDDFRVHIQPTGRPDLDVVLIHLTDVTVKAGDQVVAGETPIARIRDIYQYLDESLQLRNYTAQGDNGNHTHIQVNDATHPEYTALDELKPQPVEDPAMANAAASQ